MVRQGGRACAGCQGRPLRVGVACMPLFGACRDIKGAFGTNLLVVPRFDAGLRGRQLAFFLHPLGVPTVFLAWSSWFAVQHADAVEPSAWGAALWRCFRLKGLVRTKLWFGSTVDVPLSGHRSARTRRRIS